MAHTYVSVAEFNDHLRDTGSSTFASESALIVARKLALLEAVSRDLDAYCARSKFGSGFGPRVGTNRYDGGRNGVLRLEDDLISLTSLKVYDTTAGTTYTAETDFYLEPYDTTPRRKVIFHGLGALSTIPSGHRMVEMAGTWGERDQRRTATATASAIGTTTTTTVTVTAGAEFSPGQTILIDTEQMYVTAVAGSALTVRRGQNGTTAATHGAAAAISIYEYHPSVISATLLVGHKRWKSRDAGSDGTEGGGDVPTVQPQGESSILRNTVGHLRLPAVG